MLNMCLSCEECLVCYDGSFDQGQVCLKGLCLVLSSKSRIQRAIMTFDLFNLRFSELLKHVRVLIE